MKKLLREWEALPQSNGKLVLESREQNSGRIFLTGPMQRADQPNQNKRIYPLPILNREFENYQKIVREGRATAELDHPDTSTVSLERVSHIVREQYWDGKTWMGRIEILKDLPMGRIAEGLIDAGVTLGISSRGVGSTETGSAGIDVVQDDFTLVCFDLVQEPSTHMAFMNLSESRRVGPVGLSKADKINRILREISEGRR